MARKFTDGVFVLPKDPDSIEGWEPGWYGKVEQYNMYWQRHLDVGYVIEVFSIDGEIQCRLTGQESRDWDPADEDVAFGSRAKMFSKQLAAARAEVGLLEAKVLLCEEYPDERFSDEFFRAYGRLRGIVPDDKLFDAARAVSGGSA